MAARAKALEKNLSAPAKLLTFSPMIDSEACRLLLAHYGVPFREEPHLFGWASLLSLRHGCTVRIPLLYGTQYRLAGPHQINQYFEKHSLAERKLVPEDKSLSDQTATDWDRLNQHFGTAVAVFAYYHLLPHREIMLEPFSRGVPGYEQSFLQWGYSAFAGLFRLLLRLNAQHASDSLDMIRSVFDETDKRLADGPHFLLGDALTLSDIALASSAAPVLLPKGFDAALPRFEQMPPEMKSIIEELRQHETGRLVQRVYDAIAAQKTAKQSRPPSE